MIERPSGVSSASDKAARRRRIPLVYAGHQDEFSRLPVAERDGAGLVEQQRVHVAGGLDSAPRHRQDVVLHQAVRSAMPIAETSPPIVVGIKQTSSETSTN